MKNQTFIYQSLFLNCVHVCSMGRFIEYPKVYNMSVPPKSIFSLLSCIISPAFNAFSNIVFWGLTSAQLVYVKNWHRFLLNFIFLKKNSKPSTDRGKAWTDLLWKETAASSCHCSQGQGRPESTFPFCRLFMLAELDSAKIRLLQLSIIGQWSCFGIIIICETIQSKCNNYFFSKKWSL